MGELTNYITRLMDGIQNARLKRDAALEEQGISTRIVEGTLGHVEPAWKEIAKLEASHEKAVMELKPDLTAQILVELVNDLESVIEEVKVKPYKEDVLILPTREVQYYASWAFENGWVKHNFEDNSVPARLISEHEGIMKLARIHAEIKEESLRINAEELLTHVKKYDTEKVIVKTMSYSMSGFSAKLVFPSEKAVLDNALSINGVKLRFKINYHGAVITPKWNNGVRIEEVSRENITSIEGLLNQAGIPFEKT